YALNRSLQTTLRMLAERDIDLSLLHVLLLPSISNKCRIAWYVILHSFSWLQTPYEWALSINDSQLAESIRQRNAYHGIKYPVKVIVGYQQGYLNQTAFQAQNICIDN